MNDPPGQVLGPSYWVSSLFLALWLYYSIRVIRTCLHRITRSDRIRLNSMINQLNDQWLDRKWGILQTAERPSSCRCCMFNLWCTRLCWRKLDALLLGSSSFWSQRWHWTPMDQFHVQACQTQQRSSCQRVLQIDLSGKTRWRVPCVDYLIALQVIQ